jgi:hypothetical protein
MAQQPPAPPPPPPPGPPPPGQPPGGPVYGGAPAYGARPGGVTAGAIVLIILGALYAIFGLIAMIGGGAVAGQFSGAAGGVIIVVGLIVVAFGVLDIISGARILGLSSGWRIAGIVLASIGALFALLGTIGGFTGGGQEIDPQTFEVVSTGPSIGAIIFGLLFLAANVFVIVQLARHGRYFVR